MISMLFVAAIFLGQSSVPAAESPVVTVRGVVVDPAGKPVPGASITCYAVRRRGRDGHSLLPEPLRTVARSDASGAFTIAARAGLAGEGVTELTQISLSVSHSAYAFSEAHVDLPTDAVTRVVLIPSSKLTVRVSYVGMKIANATVHHYSDTAVTNERGEAELVVRDWFWVWASAEMGEGSRLVSQLVSGRAGGEDQTIKLELRTAPAVHVNLRADADEQLTGPEVLAYLVDGFNLQQIDAAQITKTDAGFDLTGIPYGRLNLWAHSDHYVALHRFATLERDPEPPAKEYPSMNVVVHDVTEASEVATIHMQRKARLEGVVVTADGQPLAGARVVCASANLLLSTPRAMLLPAGIPEIVSDVSGNFSAEVPSYELDRVRAEREGFVLRPTREGRGGGVPPAIDLDLLPGRVCRLKLVMVPSLVAAGAEVPYSEVECSPASGLPHASSGGFLGISFSTMGGGADAIRGIHVVRVVADSAAADAGLTAGDVILAVDGRPVATSDANGEEFRKLVKDASPGTRLRLSIQRGDQTIDLTATIRARSE